MEDEGIKDQTNAGVGAGTNVGTTGNTNAGNTTAPQIDYDKLAEIVAGKQKVTEDTILKSYLKQQGLSGDELTQAISSFKTEKAKNTPDPTVLQTQLTTANKALLTAQINNQAQLEAMTLGLDTKAIPYVLKMADFSNSTNADGTINVEEVKKALEKVVTDIPALKGNANVNGDNNVGGFQIGGSTGANNDQKTQEDTLRSIFGIKK